MQTDAKALPNPGAAHAVVVGGGTMGADVAVVLTRASCRTTVIESNPERAAGLPARVAENLDNIGRKENVALLATAPDLDGVDWAGVDLVIECIPERLDIKQALFADLERRARPDAFWPATVPASRSAPSARAWPPAAACWACTSSCPRTWCRWSRWCWAKPATPPAPTR